MKLAHKIFLGSLLVSIPLNFVLLAGIGNIYLSTACIFLFSVAFFITGNEKILKKQNILLSIILLVIILATTYLNVFFNAENDFKSQSVASVIYIQNFLAFGFFYYLLNEKSFQFFIHSFITITILSCLRVILEESHRILLFSTLWKERIQAYFIGAVNNFALICGLSFFMSFFFIKNKIARLTICLFLFFMIAASMSRGAFLGVFITLFAVAVYDTNKRTLKLILKYGLFALLAGVASVFYFNRFNAILEKIQTRFLSVFSGETGVSQFSSGRFFVWEDILIRFSKANIFEFLFGFGNGSIDFSVAFVNYHSSHNIFIDLLYKNGILILFSYFLILAYIFYDFLKNRTRDKRGLFALFFFLHFEIMFNPFPFAAQTGWLYFGFLALFILQNKLINKE